MLLAVASAPPGVDVAALVAAELGVARAEVAHRVAGVLPRAVAFEAEGGRLQRAAEALSARGVTAFALDQAQVPSDAQRFIVRTIDVTAGGVVLVDRQGARSQLAPSAVLAFQRGQREHTSTETVETSKKSFSLGRAVVSGGLVMTRTEKQTSTTTHTSRQGFLLVHRVDGEPDALLLERQLDYRFITPRPEPSSFANATRTLQLLRALAPAARLDERVGRPGFLAGPLAALPNGLDVGLELIRQALLRGV